MLGIETVLTMDARLGYTYDIGSKHPNWTEVARSTEDRPLECSATKVHMFYQSVIACGISALSLSYGLFGSEAVLPIYW